MANDYINMLKERDKALPMRRYYYKSEPLKNEPPEDMCPKCETIIALDKYRFCPVCGQRLDRDNYAFE